MKNFICDGAILNKTELGKIELWPTPGRTGR